MFKQFLLKHGLLRSKYLPEIKRYVKREFSPEENYILFECCDDKRYYRSPEKSLGYNGLSISSEESTACSQRISKAITNSESISDYLLRMKSESGITDSEISYNANMTVRHLAMIFNDNSYRLTKNEALAFAIALKLSIKESEHLLTKAGYSLSESILTDVILRYCIESEIYDIYEINSVLKDYKQQLLGA